MYFNNYVVTPFAFYYGFFSDDFESIYEFSGKELFNSLYKDYECTLVKNDKLNPYSVIFKISYENYKKIFESKTYLTKKFQRI